MAPRRLLIVDDEPLIRETLAEYLGHEGFAVTTCATGEEALTTAGEHHFEVVLCDVQLPDLDGLELLDRLLKISPDSSVLLITAYATVENAIQAFQRGAHDYLMKPLLLDEVAGKVRRLLAARDLALENQWLRRELNRRRDEEKIVGTSPAMQAVFEVTRKVARTRSTVLLTGESGTGKELIARAIHRGGADADKRFLPVNCAAIPHDLLENQLFGHRKGAFTGADRDTEGLFVHAGRGTIFLDEIGEMPPATQAKLLRAIEQKEVLPVGANEPVCVEARILAASNKHLGTEVEAGRFRDDLYYRLNVVSIRLPALRERREDIPDLVEYLLDRHARTLGKPIHGVTHEAMQRLRAGRWKGNVRELDNVLQRAVILGDGPLIGVNDLPADLALVEDDPSLVDDLVEAVRRFERLHIERVLAQVPDKKTAAQRLGIALSSLYRRIADLGISAPPAGRGDRLDV
jgi:DNA-binding NtrC family response regulator